MWNDSVSTGVQKKKCLLQVEKSSFLPVPKSIVNTRVSFRLRETYKEDSVRTLRP